MMWVEVGLWFAVGMTAMGWAEERQNTPRTLLDLWLFAVALASAVGMVVAAAAS